MINQTYILNMIPGGIQPRIYVSQYDAGSRTLVFQLFQGDGGNGTEFEIPQGATVTIDGTKKQDKKSFSYICTYTGNSVTATVSQQMTAACGEVECQLTVNKSGAVLGSANFLLVVEHAVLPEDADLSETEIASLETWKNQALQAAEQAEASETSAAASASAASDSANAAKGSAAKAKESQTAAQASQTAAAQARTAAETAKTAAESAQAQAETALAGAQQAQSAAQQSATSAAGSASAAESSMQSAANAQQSAEAASASAESAAAQAVIDRRTPKRVPLKLPQPLQQPLLERRTKRRHPRPIMWHYYLPMVICWTAGNNSLRSQSGQLRLDMILAWGHQD